MIGLTKQQSAVLRAIIELNERFPHYKTIMGHIGVKKHQKTKFHRAKEALERKGYIKVIQKPANLEVIVLRPELSTVDT